MMHLFSHRLKLAPVSPAAERGQSLEPCPDNQAPYLIFINAVAVDCQRRASCDETAG